MGDNATLTHIGEQDLVDGMSKLEGGQMSSLHIFVQFTNGGGDAPPLGFETRPLQESSPVTFKSVDVPIGLEREVLENPPLFKLPEEGVVDNPFMNNVEVEKFVDELVVDEVTENSSCDHLEGKDEDEFLSFDNELVVLLVPEDMGEMRQGFEPFVSVTDHGGEELGDFRCGKVWVDVGPETTPIFVVFHTSAVAEDSAQVLSKASVGVFGMVHGITVVICTNVIRVGQDSGVYGLSGTFRGLGEPLTFQGCHHRTLDTRDRTFDGIR